MLSLGVRNQVAEKCWCKLVLFGPDCKGLAEITTEEKKSVSITVFVTLSLSRKKKKKIFLNLILNV